MKFMFILKLLLMSFLLFQTNFLHVISIKTSIFINKLEVFTISQTLSQYEISVSVYKVEIFILSHIYTNTLTDMHTRFAPTFIILL